MKKTLAVLLSLCLLLPCLFTGWTLPASAADTTVNPEEITGTVDAGYKPAADAKGIASLSEITDLAGSYYLTADIAANDTTVAGEFSGTFDGNGHSITSSVPLFEFVFGGTVQNLSVLGKVTFSQQTGAVARFAAAATFSNIWNRADVTTTATTKYLVAGLVAGAKGSVLFENCRNSGTITGNGNQTAGICAWHYSDDLNAGNELTFRNCANDGLVSGGSDMGGIFGANSYGKSAVFENCVNRGEIKSTNDRPGGIAGVLNGKSVLTDCVNYANISSAANYAAGIVSRIGSDVYDVCEEARLVNCTNYGEITSLRNQAGGIAAYVTANALVINCTNKASGKLTITNNGGNMGGIISTANRSLVCFNCTNEANLVGRTETEEGGEEGTQEVRYMPDRVGGIVAAAEGWNADPTGTENEKRAYGNLYFEGCVNTGNLEGKLKAGGIAGGLSGSSWNHAQYGAVAVLHCLNTGNITLRGNDSTTDHSSNAAGGIVGYFYGCGTSSYIYMQYCATYGDVINNTNGTHGNAAYFLGYTNSPQAVIRYNIGSGTLKGPINADNDEGVGYPLMYNGNATNAAPQVRDNFIPQGLFTFYIFEEGSPNQRGASEYTAEELASGALVARANNLAGIKEAFYQVLGTDARPVTVKSADNAMVKAVGDTYVNTTEGDPAKPTVTTETDERGYILIKNETDFVNMEITGKYVLANDLTLTNGYSALYGFWGELDGNGKTVTTSVPMFDRMIGSAVYNLTVRGEIKATAEDTQSLGSVVRTAESVTLYNIKNYANIDATLAGGTHAGGIAGNIGSGTLTDCVNYGTVSATSNAGGMTSIATGQLILNNCVNETGADITGNSQVGGLVGWSYSYIYFYDCVNNATVECKNNYAGGILGRNMGEYASTTASKTVFARFYRCVNNGEVRSKAQYTAGIVGYSCGNMYAEDCVNNGKLTSTGAQSTSDTTNKNVNGGGIVAQCALSGTLIRCVNNADINLPKGNVGGIAGKLNVATSSKNLTSKMIDCVNNGAITAPYASAGLLGRFEYGTLEVEGCVNEKAVTVTASLAGGLLGNISEVKNPDNKVTVKNSVNRGEVKATGTAAGIVSCLYAGSLTVENCLNIADVTSSSSGITGGLVASVNGNKKSADGKSYGGKQATIRYSGSIGNVSGVGHTGGILGYQFGTGTNGSAIIEYCFTIGNVSSTTSYASGILGYSNTDQSQINYCYGSGKVTSGKADYNGNPCANAIMWDNKLALASYKGNVFEADYAPAYITEKGASTANGAELFDNTADYVFAKADVASGALAVMLNEKCGKAMWTQTLGTDAYPRTNVTGGKTVSVLATEGETVIYTNGFVSMNINAGTDLTVKYYFTISGNVAALTNALNASIRLGGKTVTVPSTAWKMTETAAGSGIYVCEISCADVAPQSMGETIVATLGTLTNESNSIKSYLLSLVGMTDAEMKTAFGYEADKAKALRVLAADLIVYGAAAQAYNGYGLETAPIMDAATEKAIADYRSDGAVPTADKTLANNGTGATFKGASVLFGSKVKLAFRLADIAAGAVVKLGINGTEVELTETVVTENGTYYYTPEINPTAYGTVYTVTVYVNGVAGANATYSVNVYAAAMQNSGNTAMGALAVALYHYGVASAAFNA